MNSSKKCKRRDQKNQIYNPNEIRSAIARNPSTEFTLIEVEVLRINSVAKQFTMNSSGIA